MALSYKNIVITPNIGQTADPKIVFSGASTTSNTDITIYAYPDSNGTLSFEGSAGQLFSITNDIGNTVFGVYDASGVVMMEANATTSTVYINPTQGSLAIGNTVSTTNSSFDIYTNYTNKTVATSNTINCAIANYFTNTATGTMTFTFNSVPTNRAYGFLLELTNGGAATVTWPTAVKWPSATAPSLTASGVDLLGFVTDDGGTTWRGVASMLNSS